MEQDEKLGHQTGGISIIGDNITIYGDVVGRDKKAYNVPRPPVRDKNQLILLSNVKADWIEGVLKKSVYGEALIELGKHTEPAEIEHPWNMALDTQDCHREPVPPGKKVAEIFREVQDALLVLGEPGSGKTITLLELARDLITRAEQDTTKPVPVVLNLSSWQARDKKFEEWVVRELNSKYRVMISIAHNWIKSVDLVLLLDGLDEVAQPLRVDCAESINRFLLEGQIGIAIY
ncbi:MAG TPA: NACHT domain-containing protein, partial [Candidatus Angelobacter sp.]